MNTDIVIKLETETGTTTEASMDTKKVTKKRVQKPQEGYLHPQWTPKGTKKRAKKNATTKSRVKPGSGVVDKQTDHPDLAIRGPETTTTQPSMK